MYQFSGDREPCLDIKTLEGMDLAAATAQTDRGRVFCSGFMEPLPLITFLFSCRRCKENLLDLCIAVAQDQSFN